MSTPHRHLFTAVKDIKDFMFAGNARLTLVSKNTGARYTYRIRQPKNRPGATFAKRVPHFVQVLTGPDNAENYKYIGTLFDKAVFAYGAKSTIHRDAPSIRVFEWFWGRVTAQFLPSSLEVWHEGRCGRCGRALTVPESIERGIGPECVKVHEPQLQRNVTEETGNAKT